MVDGSEQPSGDGDDGLFLAAPLLKGLLLSVDFRMLLTAAGSKRDLDQQGLEISAGFADAGSFLLTGALRVLRGRASPGAEMLGGIKHRQVCDHPRDIAADGQPAERQAAVQPGRRVPLRVLPLSEHRRGQTAPGTAEPGRFPADCGGVSVPRLCQRRAGHLYAADPHESLNGDEYQEDPAADEE